MNGAAHSRGADQRRLPFDGQTALDVARGQVDAARFVPGRAARVCVPETPLLRSPSGGMDKAVLFGEPITVISENGGLAFVQSGWDGYVGYLDAAALGAPVQTSHHVIARASHLYPAPDFKAPALHAVSLGAALSGRRVQGRFLETPDGFVPTEHVAEAAVHTPVSETARRLIGTPYLWGGNSSAGIDCSGFVQLAFRLAGRPCPRDSDQQAAEIGRDLPAGTPLQRDDVICWRGHVGLMLDDQTLIHANAHHMAVATEPLSEARARIGAREFGEVTTIRRVD